MSRAWNFKRVCMAVVAMALVLWCVHGTARAGGDDLRDDPSLSREERIRRYKARLKKLEDEYRAEATDHEKQRLEDELKALEQQRKKLQGKQPQSVAELLGRIDAGIAKARVDLDSAKETAKEFQELKDEDLRDDSDLPRAERLRRHKLKLQEILTRYRAHDAERRLQELQQRREVIVESQTQFEAELAEALKRAEAAESEKRHAEEKRKALEELRAEIRAKLAEMATGIKQAELKRRSAEERLKEIEDERSLTSGTLSPEDENERRSELQEQKEVVAREREAASEKHRAEDRRIVYEDQLSQLETMVAGAIAIAPVRQEISAPPATTPLVEPAERFRDAAVALESVTEPLGYAIASEAPEAVLGQRLGIKGFLRERALDLCDLFRFRFHVSRGYRSVGFKARGTVLAQAGMIYFDGQSAGIDRRGAGVWRARRFEGGIGPAYFSDVSNEMISGNRFTDVHYPWSRLHRRGIVRNGLCWDDGRFHPLSCGAELQLFIGGLEFELYPLEWFDALLGWLGLDSSNDDESRILRRWAELQGIAELQVRDEWSESLEPKAEWPPVAEEIAPPLEESITEPEALTHEATEEK